MGDIPKRSVVVAALVATAIGVAACGSSSSTSSGSSTAVASSSTTASATGGGVAEAKQRLDALYRGVTFRAPPSSGPKPQAGKNVWLIDTSLAAPEGALVAQGVQAAGRLLGWNTTVYDGKFQPSRYLDGVRQAIAAKADGIFMYAIDCASVRAALQEARAARVQVVGAESADCGAGSSALFDGTVEYSQGDFFSWAHAAGAAEADWAIVKTDGKAKVINLFENDLGSTRAIQAGFADTIKTCAGCKIVDSVTFDGTELGPRLQEKTQQAILKNPDANVLMVPYDGAMTSGPAAAVMASGRRARLNVVAGGGLAPNMDLVRKDAGENAGYSTSLAWEGWAGMDALNRLFEGQRPQPSGIGMMVFDIDHNMPASGAWVAPVDFAAAYTKAWKG
ncbi:MAG: monosaccharide transporter substrate-binding protein family [Conexibacter sp.]|nr:monosaccharide transporter substrate-binding protein family [Conexibacter sp.]